jgi:hypothetical protein
MSGLVMVLIVLLDYLISENVIRNPLFVPRLSSSVSRLPSAVSLFLLIHAFSPFN